MKELIRVVEGDVIPPMSPPGKTAQMLIELCRDAFLGRNRMIDVTPSSVVNLKGTKDEAR